MNSQTLPIKNTIIGYNRIVNGSIEDKTKIEDLTIGDSVYYRIGDDNTFNKDKYNKDGLNINIASSGDPDFIKIGKQDYTIEQYPLYKVVDESGTKKLVLKIPAILKQKSSGGSKQNKTKFRKSKNNRKSRKNLH